MKPNDQPPADDLARAIRALNEKLLGAYLRRVGDRNPRIRRKAAKGLGSLGPLAAEAVPALESLCRDRHPAVRDSARWALAKIRS
jgi:HEAT repeat protein